MGHAPKPGDAAAQKKQRVILRAKYGHENAGGYHWLLFHLLRNAEIFCRQAITYLHPYYIFEKTSEEAGTHPTTDRRRTRSLRLCAAETGPTSEILGKG